MPVVVAKYRSATDIRALAHVRIADITQMRALDAFSKPRSLDLDEIAHSATFVHNGMPKPCKRSDIRARAHV